MANKKIVAESGLSSKKSTNERKRFPRENGHYCSIV
jgi:hypothetical protein